MNVRDTGQLSLLLAAEESDATAPEERKGAEQHTGLWQLFIDGAARNNPGHAGAGVYIVKDGVPFYQDGYYLGEQTNNQAEYIAGLLGRYFLEQWKQPHEHVQIYSDSQLLVYQMRGTYRVRNQALVPRHRAAIAWMKKINGVIRHIPREDNYHADAMANQGIDLKKTLPASFLARVKIYEDMGR
jgi:ribonuclease HI